jgi:hypothetical protein
MPNDRDFFEKYRPDQAADIVVDHIKPVEAVVEEVIAKVKEN